MTTGAEGGSAPAPASAPPRGHRRQESMYAMTGLYSEHAAPEGEETEGAGPSAADTPIPVHPTSHVKCHSRNPSSGIVDKYVIFIEHNYNTFVFA